MSVADQINRIKTNIANTYTAAQAKGATMPQTQNSDNLAACVQSITTGGGGATWSDPHQVDSAGRLTLGNTGVANFAGIRTIADKALWRCNKSNPNVTSALFPDLEVVEDATADIATSEDLTTNASALGEAFMSANALTTLKMPKLKTIGKAGLSRLALQSRNVGDIFTDYGEYGDWAIFPELEEVGEWGLYSAFSGTNVLQYVAENSDTAWIFFPKLKTLGAYAMRELFKAGANTDFPETVTGEGVQIIFPALTTVDESSFLLMFYRWTQNGPLGVGLHFLPDMEATITACTGYPNFGATSGVTVSFDADQYM